MFKGREKELYIILSLPSVIYLQTKRKNMVYNKNSKYIKLSVK